MKITGIATAFIRFGRRIIVSPKANAQITGPGAKVEVDQESVIVNIRIGDSHTGLLIMGIDAWKALNKGAEATILTTEQHKRELKTKA